MKTRPDLQIAKPKKVYPESSKENIPPFPMHLTSIPSSFAQKKKKWRRKRKNSAQVTLLIEEFMKNPNWTKEKVVFLAEKTGLSENQVYKWGWDYQKKLRKQSVQCSARELLCKEIMPFCKIDLEMVEIQKMYKESMVSMNSIVPIQLLF